MKKGLRVFVYRNLHRKCFSVKSLATGRVIAHVDEIVLRDAEFRVSQAGRKRVLRERRKNVHAGVVGFWDKQATARARSIKVMYNPYLYQSFVTVKRKRSIQWAPVCVIKATGVSI